MVNCFLTFSATVYDPFPLMFASAPEGTTTTKDTVDNDDISIGGSVTDEEDDFEKLKRTRDEERLSR